MNDISFRDPQLLPYCQFLTIGDNYSVRFIITTLQFATPTCFASRVDKLILNDISVVHYNVRSLFKNKKNIVEIIPPSCSKSPDITTQLERKIKENPIKSSLSL